MHTLSYPGLPCMCFKSINMSGDSSLLPLSTYLVLLYSDTTAQGGVKYVHFAAHSM